MKTADEIIHEFTGSCAPAEAGTIFLKLHLANAHYRRKETPHPDAPDSVDNTDEKVLKAIRAISTLLYEIEKSMKVASE